jgi:hypothetical protein
LARGCHRIVGIFVQDLDDLKPLEALVAEVGLFAEALTEHSASSSWTTKFICAQSLKIE